MILKRTFKGYGDAAFKKQPRFSEKGIFACTMPDFYPSIKISSVNTRHGVFWRKR